MREFTDAAMWYGTSNPTACPQVSEGQDPGSGLLCEDWGLRRWLRWCVVRICGESEPRRALRRLRAFRRLFLRKSRWPDASFWLTDLHS
jgi:hypothetical protein